MKKLLYLILPFFTLQVNLLAQVNLVPNGNFEKTKQLPSNLLINDNINNYLQNWESPIIGTSADYFNFTNTIPQYKYPNIVFPPNFLGISSDSINKYITPVSGDAFVGIFNKNINSKIDNYSNFYYLECLGVGLDQTLKKNHKYSGSFFFNNFGEQSLLISDIGMIVCKDTTSLRTKYTGSWIPIYYNNPPQIKNKSGLIVSSDQWVQVQDIFKANGNESYVIISYFKNDSSIEQKDSSLAKIETNWERYTFQNYFFIDSVTLYEIPCIVAQDSACKGDNFYHTFIGPTIWTQQADSTSNIISKDSVYSFIANQSGWYYVFTSTGKDSSYLTVIDKPTIELVQDTFFCEGSSITLSPNITNSTSLMWQDSSSTPKIEVNLPGYYWVKAINSGCSITDSIFVVQQPKPDLLSKHQFTICSSTSQYETLDLNPNYNYTWQTLKDTLNTITFTHEGCEKVIIQSKYACTIKDEVCVTDLCIAKVFVPNAFVPNGVNNSFKPIASYIKSIHWEVYNKWGEKVFETDNQNTSWDGTFKGTPCSNDVYFYKVNYIGLIDTELITITGTLTLLR
jgi:gliding motility-associated-like protein